MAYLCDEQSIMSRLREALDQLDFVRRYTRERLESVPLSEWFTLPPGGVSHIAWQVGHIAMAEYLLCLARLRPRTTADEALISDAFLTQFGRQSDPTHITGISAEEIRDVYHRVHAQVLAELPHYPEADLDLPVLRPHPLFTSRIASLRYAPLHEMLHCGQIALIRRMLGYPPIW